MGVIPLISPIVVWYWIIRVKTWGRFSASHPMVNSLIILSAGISVGLVVWAGLSQLLSFIPQSWGSQGGSGEFTPLSITLSTIAAVIAAISFVYAVNKIKGQDKRIKVKDESKDEPKVTSPSKTKAVAQKQIAKVKVQKCPQCLKEIQVPDLVATVSVNCPSCNAIYKAYRGIIIK